MKLSSMQIWVAVNKIPICNIQTHLIDKETKAQRDKLSHFQVQGPSH